MHSNVQFLQVQLAAHKNVLWRPPYPSPQKVPSRKLCLCACRQCCAIAKDNILKIILKIYFGNTTQNSTWSALYFQNLLDWKYDEITHYYLFTTYTLMLMNDCSVTPCFICCCFFHRKTSIVKPQIHYTRFPATSLSCGLVSDTANKLATSRCNGILEMTRDNGLLSAPTCYGLVVYVTDLLGTCYGETGIVDVGLNTTQAFC